MMQRTYQSCGTYQIGDLNLTATSRYLFNQQVDQLPNKMARWVYEQVTVTGDHVGENGQVATEILDLWRRDPLDCIRELIGNPAFREIMAYAPEQIYSDEDMHNRVINEMWTGDWWWDVQVRDEGEGLGGGRSCPRRP